MWGVKLGVFHGAAESILSICFAQKTFLWLERPPQHYGLVMSHHFSLWFSCFRGGILAQGMFFVQNRCLQWIQHHEKPLVWALICYLKLSQREIADIFLCEKLIFRHDNGGQNGLY